MPMLGLPFSITIPLPPLYPFLKTPAIHLFVVGAKLPGLDLPPPTLVRAIPLHCLTNPFFKRHLRLPAKITKPAAIDGIPSIVPGTVCDEPDQGLGFA